MDILKVLQTEFSVSETHIKNIVELIDDGNTIPFIARYRKEMTGSCDDQKLRDINDRLSYLRNLEKRKEEVLSSIEEQGKLTEEIADAVAAAALSTFSGDAAEICFNSATEGSTSVTCTNIAE